MAINWCSNGCSGPHPPFKIFVGLRLELEWSMCGALAKSTFYEGSKATRNTTKTKISRATSRQSINIILKKNKISTKLHDEKNIKSWKWDRVGITNFTSSMGMAMILTAWNGYQWPPAVQGVAFPSRRTSIPFQPGKGWTRNARMKGMGCSKFSSLNTLWSHIVFLRVWISSKKKDG